MDFDYIKAWLERYNASVMSKCRLCGILGLIIFPIALVAGFILVFVIVGAFTTDRSGFPRVAVAFWISLGVMPCLFLGNYLMRDRRKEKRWNDESADSVLDLMILRYKLFFAIIGWVLFTGPRLLSWSLDSFRNARLISQQDTHSCAALLWLLNSRPSRVPLEEIPTILEWLNLESTMPELQKVPGVLYFPGPPAGLTLSTDLRSAIKNDKYPE
ncbi:MAG: hypothetical protein JWO95_1962 [Verrucomicrobiales bacterium]|nr:hypothetical protein [Verrucomicrobiales bacterium]